nr:right-handed parallel beta-helix repeat-containing protein [Lysinibacillus timonensis]
MTILKLFSAFFSNVKSIKRALQRSNKGDQIKLSPKVYRESIHFEKDVFISSNGEENEETIIEGIIIVPKSVKVTIQNVTISPTSQMYIEGNLKLENCRVLGNKADVLISANGGLINVENCELNNAKEVAVALMNNSKAYFKNCLFHHNGKMQMLVQESEAIIEQCEFTDAKHGFWIKERSKVYSDQNHLHHHSGTQVIVDHSSFEDFGSKLERSEGNGVYGSNNSEITMQNSTLLYHSLPQIWIQKSQFKGQQCFVQHGDESGFVILNESEAYLSYSEVSNHPKENIKIENDSRLSIEHCHIHSGKAVGIHIKDNSIVHFLETIIKYHSLSQLYITENSICSMDQCIIKDGYHVGIFVDKKSSVSLVKTEISRHSNVGLTGIDSQVNVYQCEIIENKGNGLLAIEKSVVDIEDSRFFDNSMAHIAIKTNVIMSITQCEFFNGKSIYAVNKSEVFILNSKFSKCEQVQIEISDQSTAVFDNCYITQGASYGVKITRNSIANFINSQISHHVLAQVVVNDSSLILNNCELIEGKRNALLIQNHSEVFIRDSYIAKHMRPQIWIDYESTVDLDGVQITDGYQSDLLAQNRSAIYVSDSIIRNERFRYNVQAMNYSKIKLSKTVIENKFGDVFYSENNSFITTSLDEMD